MKASNNIDPKLLPLVGPCCTGHSTGRCDAFTPASWMLRNY